MVLAEAEAWVGPYRLERRLACGGMGEIHLADHKGRRVAVKLLMSELAADPTIVQMFHDEAKLACGLIHPNIVRAYELGKDGSRYYLSMEYVPGQAAATLVAALSERR